MRAEEKNRDKIRGAGNKGSLTVEALLFLIPFMIAFFTLINAARFVQAEMLIHHAVTQTAKQISAYSYVLTKTKISDRIISTNKKSADFQVTVEKSTKSLKDFANAMGDMDGLVEDVFGFVKNQGEQWLITEGVGMLTKNNIKNEISLVSDDPNEYLENIGIEGGLAGLHFDNTRCLDNTEGKGNVKIVVTYTMKNVLFPDFDIGQYEFRQCAYTLIW